MMNMWQMIYAVSLLMGVLATAFTAGYNWRRITQLEDVLSKHVVWAETGQRLMMERMEQQFVRKDVLAESLMAVRTELLDIKHDIQAIRQVVLRGTTNPSP